MTDVRGMNNAKVTAAKRLVDALNSDLDFALYLDGHPNEKRAMDRLERDLSKVQPIEYKGDRSEVMGEAPKPTAGTTRGHKEH